ncbi:MAG: L,D-transpeptidase family protein [Lachnospiraceae bacterium]|nr:L,D-transpeptidase family protein [Lachnospiraceae bacterium]
MHKHTKLRLALSISALMMVNSTTFAFADALGPGGAASESQPRVSLEGPSGSTQQPETTAASDATAESETSGTIVSGTAPAETQGAETAVTPESTAAQNPAETAATAEGGNNLTEEQAAELTAEQAAAEAEAAQLNNPLVVPVREPLLHTAVLLNGTQNWSQGFINDQQVESEGQQSFSSLCTFLENIHGNILYRAYTSERGWTGWAMNGQQTTHESRWVPIEAIQYRFAGPVADRYDIYYSTILNDGTHTSWAKNGETAGTMGQGLYITGFRLAFFVHGTTPELDSGKTLISAQADGIQIANGVVTYQAGNGAGYTGWGWIGSDRYYFQDNAAVTGWQYIDGLKYYFGEDGKMWSDVESLLGSDGPYVIKVNKEMNCMTIYAQDGSNGHIIPVKSFLTSVGDDTPIGTFKTPEKYRWRLMIHDVYTQYATRLGSGLPILMHSIIYDAPNPYTVWASTYNNMGIARSAGCIRLVSGDAKWVYDHCALGTTVVVYNSSVAGPFERPTIKAEIPFEQTWDPTDPNLTPEGIAAETARIMAKFNPQQ